jgi:DNA-binding transcriptional ArsR family regulator
MAVNSKMSKSREKLGDTQLRAVAELFAVLSEPTRLRILQMLQDGPANVSQIVDVAGVKQANASKQLGILYQAGVVGREKEGNQVRYSIRMPVIFDLCAVVCHHLHEEAKKTARAFG